MSAGVLSYLRQLLPTADAQLADGELLSRFASTRESAAFTELLRRHGPLVWGVCRRVLGDAHAAEDAFQATFLQLARRAGALGRDGSLAGWLHVVAARLARRARLAEERRRRRDRARVPPAPADDLTWRELRQILDTEIARLPAAYREPLLLCYLENLPRAEAARRLNVSPAVLRGRLERGRQKLRRRLENLGLPLAAALLLTKADPAPAALADTTLGTVATALAGGPVPPAVAALAAGSRFLPRIKVGVLAVVLLAVAGIGIGGEGRRAEPAAAPPPAVPPAANLRAVDALGDPLPPGVLRRLGTRRHRVQSWPLAWQSMPDGKSYLAYQRVGVSTDEVRRIDAATGRVLETWPVPDRHHAAAFSPDGRFVLLSTSFIFYTGLRLPGQKDEQGWVLTLYDLAKRRAVWEDREKLERKDWKGVDAACFSADGRWIATTDRDGTGSLRLWDAGTGREVWGRKHDGQLEPLGFAEGGKSLVACAGDNTIRLLDLATGKERRSFRTVDRRETQQHGLAPDGSAVLFGRYGPSVRVWDVATGEERRALGGHKEWARRFAFSPDGKTVVTGGNDPFVLVRAWPSGEVVRTLDLGGRSAVARMAVSGDGRRLELLFWGEQALHFYDLTTGARLQAPAEGHQAGVYGVAVAPDGALLSFGMDGTVRTWDVKSGEAVGRLAVEQDLDGSNFALGRDGRLLAVPDGNTAVSLYDRATGKRISKLEVGRRRAKRMAFSPDGRWLAAAHADDGAIQVWEVSSGRTALRFEERVTYGVSCAFSPDGRQFAVSGEGVVRFWEVGAWREQRGLAAYAPLGLAYSPDGRTLATASVEGVRLFETATHRERAHVRPPGYPGRGLQFSPTGRRLAWTDGQRTVHVWDVPRGALLPPLSGHDAAMTCLAFTADDRALVSASEDSTLLVWDVAGAAAKLLAPKPGDMGRAWRALAGDDAKAAFEAIRVLASSPDESVGFLARRLEPAAGVDAQRIAACLRDLDSAKFEERERATRELGQFGDRAAAALERFLASPPSLEARRRAEQLLEKARGPANDPERLRQTRALEALEWMGSDRARRLLEVLAKGAPEAGLTRDARAALGRMRR